jgi:hypothetical protein
MSNLNLEKYAQQKKDKERQRKKCYKKVLEQINNIIMIKMDHGANSIKYTIPMFIIGESEYDPLESIEYVIKKLTKQMLFKRIVTKIEIYDPNILYIEWDLDKI